ncbi:hypothetical protein [Lysinibacillus fusiformis]|uniref:hypothetical protein n=1 Tax=Lysinibacillus fusiformis TaxID=28031 RepID=UPI0018827BF3|nr:hypothetical protein [Lysinibacillus fusiformis]MBD8522337.1 hypothetical protein [Lysinibacillus fusiformis]
MNEKHLKGLTEAQKRLTKAYATTILGGVRTIEEVKPSELQSYVELEIAEREIIKLVDV